MENLCKFFVLSLLIIVISTPNVAQGIPQGPRAVETWFKKLPNAKEKLTKLHFFFHDIVSGKNRTALKIAQPSSTFKSSTAFGMLYIIDDALRAGPQPGSEIVGRAQGLYGSASLEEFGFLMALNFVFTQGKYKGSTVSVLGRNPVLDKYREMPVVGGSGVFRLARGIATAKTVWFNSTTKNAVVEYHVVLLHY